MLDSSVCCLKRDTHNVCVLVLFRGLDMILDIRENYTFEVKSILNFM